MGPALGTRNMHYISIEQLDIDQSMNCLAFKMSENSEKCPSRFSERHQMSACFVQPTVQNLKMLS